MSKSPVRSVVLSLALLGIFVSATPGAGRAADAISRSALILSDAAYPDSDDALSTPINDGRTLAEALQRHGFAVQTEANATEAAAAGAVKQFLATVKPGSIALIFFSGLGIEVAGKNYLIPVDGRIWSEADVLRAGISVDQLVRDIAERGATAEAVILDASRRNPFERRFRSVPAGLAPMAASPGTLSLSASAPGGLVEDEPGATDGIFTTELVKALNTPGLDAEQAFSQCRDAVAARTRDRQTPSLVSGLDIPFSFDPDRSAAVTPQPLGPRPSAPSTNPEPPQQAATASVAKLETVPPPAPKPTPGPAAPQPAATLPAAAVEPTPPAAPPPAPKPTPGPAAPQPAATLPAAAAEPAPPAASPPAPKPTPGPAAPQPAATLPAAAAEPAPTAVPPPAPKPTTAPAAPQQTASLPKADPVPPQPSDQGAPPTETPLSAAEAARQAELSRRISRDPRDQDAFFERGRLLAQHGSYSLALLDLDRAISLNPNDADALNDRCWTRTMVNQLQTALDDCNQALKLRPNFADAHDSRGLALMKRGTIEAALADYDAAIKLDPQQSSAFYGRGIAKLRLGRRQDAEKDISSALAINPDIESDYARYGLK